MNIEEQFLLANLITGLNGKDKLLLNLLQSLPFDLQEKYISDVSEEILKTGNFLTTIKNNQNGNLRNKLRDKAGANTCG